MFLQQLSLVQNETPRLLFWSTILKPWRRPLPNRPAPIKKLPGIQDLEHMGTNTSLNHRGVAACLTCIIIF